MNYLRASGESQHGLASKQAKLLAYEVVIANDKTVPESWKENKCVGKDWFTLSLERNPQIILRIPEPTALAIAMGFNKPVVNKFFHNLQHILAKYTFTPNKIFNTDETALTTVLRWCKVLVTKDKLDSSHCTLQIAIGNSVPLLLIFPRVSFHDHMLKGAPP